MEPIRDMTISRYDGQEALMKQIMTLLLGAGLLGGALWLGPAADAVTTPSSWTLTRLAGRIWSDHLEISRLDRVERRSSST